MFIRFLWLWLFVWSDEEPFTTSLWGQCQDAPNAMEQGNTVGVQKNYAIARAMAFHQASCSSVSGAENSPSAVFTINLSPPTLPI